MRAITHQATGDKIILKSDTFAIAINAVALTGLTEGQIKVAVETAAKEKLDDVYIHRNRDGSIALAVGEQPKIWPEDEKEVDTTEASSVND